MSSYHIQSKGIYQYNLSGVNHGYEGVHRERHQQKANMNIVDNSKQQKSSQAIVSIF